MFPNRDTPTNASIPEPTTAILSLIGLSILGVALRQRAGP